MYKQSCILFLYAESPLHPGSDSGVGAIDLPVQREVGSGLPVFHGSGIKGALKDAARERAGINAEYRKLADLEAERDALGRAGDDDAREERRVWLTSEIHAARKDIATRLKTSGIDAVFGPETQGGDHAGAISVQEGRVLLFPVRSLAGTFAWVTSPLALGRLRRDLTGLDGQPEWEIPTPEHDQALVPPASDVRLGEDGDAERHIVLDEFTFTATEDAGLAEIAHWLAKHALPSDASYSYWRERLCRTPGGHESSPSACASSNLVLLPDDDFRDFCRFATEIQSRNKINPATKTVKGTGLWTEEHLPAETVLYTKVLAADPRMPRASSAEDNIDAKLTDAARVLAELTGFSGTLVQMGGDATVGRGLVRLRAFPDAAGGQAGGDDSTEGQAQASDGQPGGDGDGE